MVILVCMLIKVLIKSVLFDKDDGSCNCVFSSVAGRRIAIVMAINFVLFTFMG